MSVNITVNGTVYPVPSGASDTNWAAQQVAFEQALATAVNTALKAPRIIYSNSTPVGTGADTTEDTLMTFTVPANTLSADKMGLRIVGWGSGVNTGDTTTLRMYVASQSVHSLVLTASQANVWRCACDVMRVSSSTATSGSLLTQGGTTTQLQTTAINGFTFDATTANVIKFTGQRASSSVASSIVQLGVEIQLVPIA